MRPDAFPQVKLQATWCRYRRVWGHPRDARSADLLAPTACPIRGRPLIRAAGAPVTSECAAVLGLLRSAMAPLLQARTGAGAGRMDTHAPAGEREDVVVEPSGDLPQIQQSCVAAWHTAAGSEPIPLNGHDCRYLGPWFPTVSTTHVWQHGIPQQAQRPPP